MKIFYLLLIAIGLLFASCSDEITNVYEFKTNCDPACERWEVCNEEAKSCELAFMACNEDTDCLDGETCVTEKHRCKTKGIEDSSGTEGKPCYENSCDAGLVCVDDICKRDLQISGNTIIFSNNEIEKDTISNEGNIISFKRTERSQRFKVDNILTSGITEKTPYGMLKKIKNIRRFEDRVEVEVEDAKLEEAVVEADIDLEKKIPISIENGKKGLNKSFNVNLAVPADGDPFFTANGSVTLSTDLDFNVKIKIWRLKLKEFKLILSLSATTELEIALNTPNLVSIEKDIGSVKINLAPITIMVGPVPVVIVSKLSVPLHYELDVVGKFSAGVTFGPVLRVGTEYDGDSWSKILETTFEKSINNPKISLDGSFKVGPKIVLSTKLYGVAGPEVSIGAYAELSGSVGIDLNGWLSWNAALKAVAEASFTFAAEILGKKLLGITFTKSKSIDIWEDSGSLTCFHDSDCIGTDKPALCIDDNCVLKSSLCPENSCSNHGICDVLNKEPFCDCEAGFSANGDLECLASCEGIDCDGHGECVMLDNQFPTCDCEDGYERYESTKCIISGCTETSCGEHGHCIDEIQCNCDLGYSYNSNTKLCEASCSDVNCGVGTCELIEDRATCNCPNGYYSDYELNCIEGTDPCANNSCTENEFCLPINNTASCFCKEGYVRDENDVCTTEGSSTTNYCEGITCSGNGTCINDEINERATCNCNDGYHRATSTTCVEDGDWQMVSAGQSHTCGIKGGALYCWGDNMYGQLGVGDTRIRLVPTQVGSSTGWTEVKVMGWYRYNKYAYFTTCGINHSKLYCWGKQEPYISIDIFGERTDICNEDGMYCHSPVLINQELGWEQISTKGNILKNGELYNLSTFEKIGTASDWSYISGALGIKNGELYAGENSKIGSYSDWVKVSNHGYSGTYDYHQCGIRNGELYCWGKNGNGQVGNGTISSNSNYPTNPVKIGSEDTWTDVAVCYNHTCGIREGKLFCWGNNSSGQLGTSDYDQKLIPIIVGDSNDWQSISLGSTYSCGINGGELYCWGYNYSGQLGLGEEKFHKMPKLVDTGGWTSISSFGTTNLGIKNNKLYALGVNRDNKFGILNTTILKSPTLVNNMNWSKIFIGNKYSWGIRDNGELYYWGNNQNTPLQIGNSLGWTDIAYDYISNHLYLYGIKNGNLYKISLDGTNIQIGNKNDWNKISFFKHHSDNWGVYYIDFRLINNQNNLWRMQKKSNNNSEWITDEIDTNNWFEATSNCSIKGGELLCYLDLEYDFTEFNDWDKVFEDNLRMAIRSGKLYSWKSIQIGSFGSTHYYSPQQIGTDSDWQDVGQYCGIKGGDLYCWNYTMLHALDMWSWPNTPQKVE